MDMPELFHLTDRDPDELRSAQENLLQWLRTNTGFSEITSVGSTAVKGLIGKGDLDFALGVPRSEFVNVSQELSSTLTPDTAKTSTDEFQAFCVPSEHDATLLLFANGSAYDVFDPFLEMMAADAELRAAYNALKREWDGKPMDHYREAKSTLVEAALKQWRGH